MDDIEPEWKILTDEVCLLRLEMKSWFSEILLVMSTAYKRLIKITP